MFDHSTKTPLFQPLTLPNGQVIPNRIAKAAMEENMADARHLPGEALLRLYRQWGAGGAGMLLTGNVMVAADTVTGPGGVVLDAQQPLQPFRAWAEAGKAQGARIPQEVRGLVKPISFAPGKGLVAITSYAYHYCDNGT